MDNKELISLLAFVHDRIEDAKKDATPFTAPAIVAVEAVLDSVLIEPCAEHLYTLRAFAGACPLSPYPPVPYAQPSAV